MNRESNISLFSLSSQDAVPKPEDLEENHKFLVSVEDWSMCEPFNKDDIVQISRHKGPLYDVPVVIRDDDGKLYLCILEEENNGQIRVMFTGAQDTTLHSINEIEVIGQAAGILRS